MSRAVGIDYSMTSPCVCIKEDGVYGFHYLSDKKKFIGIIPTHNPKFHIKGYEHKPYKNNIERYNNIGEWVISLLQPNDIINLEGYAMGVTKGVVFNIAELTGILKLKLWENGYHIESIAPTANKKEATGKGNANKILMTEAFISSTGLDLFSIFNITKTKKDISPIDDISDAYHLANYAFF